MDGCKLPITAEPTYLTLMKERCKVCGNEVWGFSQEDLDEGWMVCSVCYHTIPAKNRVVWN